MTKNRLRWLSGHFGKGDQKRALRHLSCNLKNKKDKSQSMQRKSKCPGPAAWKILV